MVRLATFFYRKIKILKKDFSRNSPYGKLQLGDEPVVLFTTYSSLVAKKHGAGRGKNSSRLGQIVNWLGADFDGLIIFDECREIDPPTSLHTRGMAVLSHQAPAWRQTRART